MTNEDDAIPPMNPRSIQTGLFRGSLNSMIEEFKIACDWLDSIGLSSRITRYGKYEKNFASLVDRFNRAASVSVRTQLKASFENSYVEANELVRLYSDLSRINSADFLRQIEFVASGQEFRPVTGDDKARDFLFELSVAARFLRAGFQISLDSISDIVVHLDGNAELHIECKRLKSPNRVKKNLAKANAQLDERISRSPVGSLAMSALDFTDLLPPRSGVVFNGFSDASTSHAYRLKRTINAHSKAFVEATVAYWNIGTMCQAVGMYYATDELTNEDALVYARHTTYAVYHDTGSSQSRFLSSLSEKIGAQDIYRQ